MFILPERPRKENPLNTIMETLSPIAQGYKSQKAKDKLENLLTKAKTPEERRNAIERIMLSPHYEPQEKSTLERMFHQERDREHKQGLMQMLFGMPNQAQGMGASGEAQGMGMGMPSQAQGMGMPSEQAEAPEGAMLNPSPAPDLSNLSDEQLLQLSSMDANIGNTARQLRDASDKKKMDNYKILAPLEKEVYEKADASRKTLKTMDYLNDLEKSGKINNPAVATLLEKIGLPWLMNNETVAYKSAVLEEMDNLKKLFGARPTVLDVQMYLESLPNIKMNPSARKKILERKKDLAGVGLLSEKAFNEEMRANPSAIGFQQRYRDRAAKMADEALSDLKKSWIKEDFAEEGTALMERNGKQFKVPLDQVKKAEESGAKVVR